jgi:hypothetical protein
MWDTKPMLRESLRRMRSAPVSWMRRLDRVAADLNVLLVMFAIGLATLDLTFIVANRLIQLPEVTTIIRADDAAAGPVSHR